MNSQQYIDAMRGADQQITQETRSLLKHSIEESILYERNSHGWVKLVDQKLSQIKDEPSILKRLYDQEDARIAEIFKKIDQMGYTELIEYAVNQEFYLSPLSVFNQE